MPYSVLRMPLPGDYGQMILLPMMLRGRSPWNYLVGDLERLVLSVIIRGPFISYLMVLPLLDLANPLLSISFSQPMLSSHL